MLKIGLTGGMGSGKTTVARIFDSLNIPVLYADDVAKTIMNEDAGLKQRIINLFGTDAYIENLLNRKYIADIVFKDAFKLEQLNALVHPATIAAADKWMNEQTSAYVIKEAALMFEAGAAAHLDYVIGVYAIALGIITIGGAFWLPIRGGDTVLLTLGGLVSILFGVVMFAEPGTGALVTLGLIAAFALVAGVTELTVAIGGKRLFGLSDSDQRYTTPPPQASR